jgi:hypothetical protein
MGMDRSAWKASAKLTHADIDNGFAMMNGNITYLNKYELITILIVGNMAQTESSGITLNADQELGCQWVRDGHHTLFVGPAGSGKVPIKLHTLSYTDC